MIPDNSIVAGFIYGSNIYRGSYARVEFPIRQNQMSPNDDLWLTKYFQGHFGYLFDLILLI